MPKTRTRKQERHAKRGSAYEELVSEILKVFDAGATVRRSRWLQGPDGPRELDVEFSGTLAGVHKQVLVECKDYDPGSTGKVGIEHVDALDSKSADLRVDFALLCSNAGFTEGAVRKAARKGIGLIAVTRRGDQRNRFLVRTEVYSRNIRVKRVTLTMKTDPPVDLANAKEILFGGLPVSRWVSVRLSLILASNPIVNWQITSSNSFRHPLDFSVDGRKVLVTSLSFVADFEGCWYVHDVAVDATVGFYDWLRQRVVLPDVANEVEFSGLDLSRGTPVDEPFGWFATEKGILPGAVNLDVMMVEGLPDSENAPNLSEYVEEADLVLEIDKIPDAARRSNRGLVLEPWHPVADPTLKLTFGPR